MENKNDIFSFHPTGSSQGSEAQKNFLKRLPGSQNICIKKAYFVGAPAQSTNILILSHSVFEMSTSGIPKCSDHYGQM